MAIVNPNTQIRAPWPTPKVTMTLPKPLFEDARATEATIQVKRTMTGGRKVYINSSNRVTLVLPFLLSRMKSLEMEAFINSYQSAKWEIQLYDGSLWEANLIGQPIERTATERLGTSTLTGKESVEVTLEFSARRLS